MFKIVVTNLSTGEDLVNEVIEIADDNFKDELSFAVEIDRIINKYNCK